MCRVRVVWCVILLVMGRDSCLTFVGIVLCVGPDLQAGSPMGGRAHSAGAVQTVGGGHAHAAAGCALAFATAGSAGANLQPATLV